MVRIIEPRQISVFSHSRRGSEDAGRALDIRQELLEAGREIFARNGFDLARIEDIVGVAGKSCSDFYAFFKDKDDVFLAIFENDLTRSGCPQEKTPCLAISASEELRVSSQRLARCLKNRKRWLLYLELHLYAQRCLRKSQRLSGILARIQTRDPGAVLAFLIAAFDADIASQETNGSVRSREPVLPVARGRGLALTRNTTGSEATAAAEADDLATQTSSSSARSKPSQVPPASQ